MAASNNNIDMDWIEQSKLRIQVYLECERGDLALELCKSVLEKDPNNEDVIKLRKVGRILYDKGVVVDPRPEYKLLLALIDGHLGGCPFKVLDSMNHFRVENRGFVCPKCDETCKSEHKLVVHFLYAHKDLAATTLEPFSCTIKECKLHFPHMFELGRHMEKMHSDANSNFEDFYSSVG